MKIVRYFFVGGAAATVDFVLFAIFTKVAGFPWFPSAIVSFIAATLFNYVVSIWCVFESGVRFRRHQEVFFVFLVSAIGLCVNQAVLWVLIENWHIEPLIAKVCGSAAVFLWNFQARHRFIFRART